jgi:rare lipoprotein A (peptidoglycan hydrolase)
MKVCLWSGKLGFESLSRNPRPYAGFEDHAPRQARRQTENRPRNFRTASENACTRTASERRLDRAISGVLLATILALIVGLLVAPREASAAWRTSEATWYGPGFYGNAFACSYRRDVPNRYSEDHSRGIAHMTLPCGTKVTICRRGVCVNVLVIDRGAFSPRNLDLTARTSRDLRGCRNCRPYTMTVRWRTGWIA